ncbi:hypothetical protein LguiA_036350 [Lonicera macranthoides]
MEDAEFPLDSGNLALKVVSIAAGEAHTLALTGDGRVYSWGRGTFGRLGTGSEGDELVPVRVKFDFKGQDKLNIVGISAGAYHSLALADNGSIWSWGYNTYGQLGFNGDNSLEPLLLEGFLELDPPGSPVDVSKMKNNKSLKVSSIKAGGMMSLAIDNQGTLWIWGNCPPQNSSNEGEFMLVSTSTPMPIWNFYGHTVVKVACGNEHIVALVSAGEKHEEDDDLICYSWGNNNHGQLGLGDKESRFQPEIIKTFDLESPWVVYDIACGAFHTAILARKKKPSQKSESVCWTFGLGGNGQLGHGTTKTAFSPKTVEELPINVFLVSVDCGLFHTSVVSSIGDVWSWGMEKGLGLCPDASFTGTDAGDAISPLLYPCNGPHRPKFNEPIQVACGAAHTVLVADGGYKLWSWGRGRSGVLGNGKTVDFFAPDIVLWPPLSEIFNDEDLNNEGDDKRSEKNEPKEMIEIAKKLSLAKEENQLILSKLSIMERYASILHGSIFGKPFEEQDIPISLKNSGTFDVAKEWEYLLESSDEGKLVRLEMFYRSMLDGVKDKIMKRRIREIVMECMNSSATGN